MILRGSYQLRYLLTELLDDVGVWSGLNSNIAVIWHGQPVPEGQA